MMRTTWVVFRKEIVDGLRDRRTLFTILIMAICMGPVSLFLIANFISGVQEKSAARMVLVDGLSNAPEFANFLLRNAYTAQTPPKGYEDQIRSGRLQEAVIVIPANFSEHLKHAQTANVTLLFDDSRSEAQPSIRKSEALLRAFAREVLLLRAMDRGINPQLMKIISIERENTATAKQQGAFLLFLIPMFALIGAVVGSTSAAIDGTAGERERGSLEPLLTNPIDLRALVLGKWLTVAAHSCGVVLLTLCGFAIATRILPNDKISALFQFGVPEFLRFCALALPFAAMIASMQMLVATYGRTFKEAQTYASYIGLIVNFVPLITIFTSVRDELWQLFVPALGQQMVLARVLRGDPVQTYDYLIPFLTAILITLVCLGLLCSLLKQERIIFGR